MKILDATAGMKGIWYQKDHPFVTFVDKRKEKFVTIEPGNKLVCKRTVNIDPDVVGDWTKKLPFENSSFDMIVFDPPHIIRKKKRKDGIIEKKYGYLYQNNYKSYLRKGIEELFRVLKPDGIFILKWCDCSKRVSVILDLFPVKPLFGTQNSSKNKDHWILFINYNQNIKLDEFQS